jgi:hypothetical protein
LNTSFWYINRKSGVFFMNNSKFLSAVEVVQSLLDDFIYMCDSREKSSYFTREGKNKLDFKTTILFMLNFVRKSLQIELDHFFEQFRKGESLISKQGFTAARRKIKPEAFIQLDQTLVEWFYNQNDYKTFMGYRLCAIDASILELNNSKRLRDAYNSSKGTSVELARAMTSCVYDIENNMIVKSIITKCNTSERDVAKQLIEKLKEGGLKKDLLIFDRGYPSIDFFTYLIDAGVKFVIRIPINNYRNTIDPALSDQMIEFKKKKRTIRLRALIVELDSGIKEILITNLFEETLNVQAFKSLYFKRWGIETKYDELKNKLQIQKFSGDTPQLIEQDFYATMFLSNMASLVQQEVDEMISKEHKNMSLKYDYVANRNILIGKLKDKLVKIILEKNSKRRKQIYKKLLTEIQRSRRPIRPGRKFNRKNTRLQANKNSLNQRTCI